jgi:hypothetical protein
VAIFNNLSHLENKNKNGHFQLTHLLKMVTFHPKKKILF